MLTKTDLQAIGKVVDSKLKNIATDISAIQVRVAEIEEFQISKLDIFEIRNLLRTVEKRITAVEGKLLKTASKEDIKNFELKVDSHSRKLQKEMKAITNFFDSEHLKLEKRVDMLDQHIVHPPIATA